MIRRGEYLQRGNYHKCVDSNWIYYPTYVAKMNYVRQYLDKLRPSALILNAGCGEGVIVQEYLKKGYKIWGLDLNYGAPHILLGNIMELPFKDCIFDVILVLDVIEHLHFQNQVPALKEISRVLKPKGCLLAAIPNLAHLTSRLKFLLRGQLQRTSKIEKHPGDRPIKEYIELLKDNGFEITRRKR